MARIIPMTTLAEAITIEKLAPSNGCILDSLLNPCVLFDKVEVCNISFRNG
jgi:hypothetical protein